VIPADYSTFIAKKSQLSAGVGFEPLWMPNSLFPFQQFMVEWAIRRGRGAMLEDCGLGKTFQQLVWAENVVRKENKPVLVATPLAVSPQTVREGDKFGIEARQSRDGKLSGPRIYVTNYEKLHLFDPNDFAGMVCDESAVMKNMESVMQGTITEFMRKLKYRLLCTATPAPNDYPELGTSSEALGDLGCMDMLLRFFKNDSKTLHIHGTKHGAFTKNQWRFKPHAQTDFWRWVCSWARALRKPSDVGFDDGEFRLPALITEEHLVKASRPAPGFLFELSATTMNEQREESRRSLPERCEKVASLVADTGNPAICWVALNDEGDLIESLVPGSVQVSGSDRDEEKEEKFSAFSSGQIRVMVTKSKVAGYGMNWQHCAHMTFFPTYSYEQYYQSWRRCLRFGQKQDVKADIITTEGSSGIIKALRRKADQADAMFSNLVRLMNDSLKIGASAYGDKAEQLPAWI
jgi:hypothetical protein